MSLNIPTESKYTSKINQLRDLLKITVPGISNSVGSIIYELVIRPIAILYAAVDQAIIDLYSKYSIKSYVSSDNTNPNSVDDIMSNYFISRGKGSISTGMMTIHSSRERTTIPAGSYFSVSGITVVASKRVHGIYPNIGNNTSSDYELFVDAYKIGDMYCFSVPVESVDTADHVIPAGVPAESLSYIPGVDSVILGSALEGGSSGETDSQLIARARNTVCSWHGGSNAIHKLLMQSGITVHSSRSFDSNDPEMLRVTGSDVFIGTGGMVDTYVKTAVSPLTGVITTNTTGRDTNITDKIPAGVISIDSVTLESGRAVDFSVLWGSSSSTASSAGARFSHLQTTTIHIDADYVDTIIVKYTYMPNIKELQQFVSREDIRPLGVDILIKAAIPTKIDIQGKSNNPEVSDNVILESVKKFINNTQVGDHKLDISDLNNHMMTNAGTYLNSPVFMMASSIDINGNTSGVTQTRSGLLEVPSTENITPRMRFMYINDSGVTLE